LRKKTLSYMTLSAAKGVTICSACCSRRSERDLRVRELPFCGLSACPNIPQTRGAKSASCQWVISIFFFFRNAIAMWAMQGVMRYSSLVITSTGIVPFLFYRNVFVYYIYISMCVRVCVHQLPLVEANISEIPAGNQNVFKLQLFI